MSLPADLPRETGDGTGLPPLALIALASTLGVLALGAAYLWVVRGEALLLDRAFAYFCL